MCHVKEMKEAQSGGCLVCSVFDTTSQRTLPACSSRAEAGMQIETHSPEARAARKEALELLLAEHAGDCHAPCTAACPAHMDIPAMIRAMLNGHKTDAARIMREALPLPRTLAHICPAPCQRVCRKGEQDQAIEICKLKLDVATHADLPFAPRPMKSEARIAIVGAGPAGLSCAYYAAHLGHRCDIFDLGAGPGGSLLNGPGATLPLHELKQDLAQAIPAGTRLITDQKIETVEPLTSYDVVIIATGQGEASRKLIDVLDLRTTSSGVEINAATHQTSRPRVLAGGGAVRPTRMAVQAIAHGHRMALTADHLLQGKEPHLNPQRFNARLGKLTPEEQQTVTPPALPEHAEKNADDEVLKEAGRCLQCDCRKRDYCQLRELSQEYDARQPNRREGMRRAIAVDTTHPDVVYELGKCIACGRCVATTRLQNEPVGLALKGRGAAIKVAPPAGFTFADALTHSADACVNACPTGALAKQNYLP